MVKIKLVEGWQQAYKFFSVQVAALLVLLGAGLLAQVEAGLAAIPDAAQRQAAQIEWEHATTVVRDSQWVRTLGASLNLTSAQLDALFIAAAKL